jgi:hypothetical protein
MHLPYNWGQPTETPGVFALGGGNWVITWSPEQVHPYAAQWLEWASRMGPAGRAAPREGLWFYGLQVRDISD